MALSQSGPARDGWSSRTAFILAAIGSAVGLGNLVRFPAEAGENGGGAFVLFYIACVILIGLPVLLSETLIGRHGQAAAPESFRKVAEHSRKSTAWEHVASLGVLSAFLILSFYCVLGGWVMYYIGIFFADIFNTGITGGAFAGVSVQEVEGIFPAMIANGPVTVILNIVFLAITMYFVSRGVSGGIEKVAVYLMPAFFVLLVGITVYGLFGGAIDQTWDYLFTFEPEKLTGPVMLAAVGQAFFSLSLGVAGMVTYGAYVGRNVNLGVTSGVIATADTLVALLAGLCIFPIVFAAGLSPNGGLGLMFQTLPHAFQEIPGGTLIGLAFFIMVGFAALTSSVSLLEAPTAWVIDRFRFTRPVATVMVSVCAAIVGTLCALSTGSLAWFQPLGFIPMFEGMGVLDTLDTLTGKITMPVGALLTSIFIGWVANKRLVDLENGLGGVLHVFWRFLVCWLCPIALSAILLVGIFPSIIE
ncbi:sodium-dependent transporter [Aurantiacibacter poecillastricola]|uniref:sodium-dependent transporter n=1 Tax=Aurantiacibacter poecillastricola TaxID=3064385 RepID=UPI00273E1814|nr:sodium-dependent transporter [Aurantiacibacter sp. 219JJ12-13]MDP5261890.1 sodium-dependent transporter [Aurantiacibacter sp. 219JJ12-13]